jgi:hypothetical protein
MKFVTSNWVAFAFNLCATHTQRVAMELEWSIDCPDAQGPSRNQDFRYVRLLPTRRLREFLDLVFETECECACCTAVARRTQRLTDSSTDSSGAL